MYSYIQVNKEIYDKLAPQYAERDLERVLDKEQVSTLANFLLDYYKGKENRFIELGPGSGQILKYFSNSGFETTGIELSSVMAELASYNSRCSKLINKNVLECTFDENSYDLIYASALIHLFPMNDAKYLLNLIRKWLTKDGLLFINTTVHNVNCEGYFGKDDYQGENLYRYRRIWKEQTFVNFILNNGFEIVDSFRTNEKSRNKKWIGLTCRSLIG